MAATIQNYECDGTLTSELVNGVSALACSGNWTVHAIQQQDIETVFAEYLSPDPEIIGLVMTTSLVFWAVGHCLGRVIRVFRKVS